MKVFIKLRALVVALASLAVVLGIGISPARADGSYERLGSTYCPQYGGWFDLAGIFGYQDSTGRRKGISGQATSRNGYAVIRGLNVVAVVNGGSYYGDGATVPGGLRIVIRDSVGLTPPGGQPAPWVTRSALRLNFQIRGDDPAVPICYGDVTA